MNSNSRIASFRSANYASAILDLENLKTQLGNVPVGAPYYFSINISNGATKVFYVQIDKSTQDGAFITKFFRDYTRYTSPDAYPNQEDYLIKGFASMACTEEETLNSAIEKTDASAKASLISYIEVFLDAVQVISSMPF